MPLSLARHVCACLLSCVVLNGCAGEEGPPRTNLKGQITVMGRPLTDGHIVFEPNVGAGNSGPQGFAEVSNGAYDTSLEGGAGVIGGPHVVRVTGSAGPDPKQPGNILNVDFQTEEELPSEPGDKNFDIPASAVTSVPPADDV